MIGLRLYPVEIPSLLNGCKDGGCSFLLDVQVGASSNLRSDASAMYFIYSMLVIEYLK